MNKILILVAQFNELVSEALLKGCQDELKNCAYGQANDIVVEYVPGSFELPVAAATAARSGQFSAIICLGCIIKGETPHFEYVAAQSASGLMRVSLDYRVPVIFGVLTTDTLDQAMNRAGLKHGNKGRDAARAAIRMVNLLNQWKES